MKKTIFSLILLSQIPITWASNCIKDTPSGYKITLPEKVSDLTLNGDKVAYCAKFKIESKAFEKWLAKCELVMDGLHHRGSIFEMETNEGIVTIIDTEKDDVVYIQIINTKNEHEFNEHIGVHRECNL